MNLIDERLEALVHTMELLARLQKLNEETMTQLTASVNSLVRIAHA
jgi:hypothetical protein